MPILVNNQVAGAVILGVGTRQPDGSEQKLVNAVCAQAGVFLHNLQQAHRLVEAAHLYHQLDLAEAVLKQLLPVFKSGIEGFEAAAFYQATNRVGGDYYDMIQTGPRQVAAVIADVAGHSLSSGLVMTAARSAFRVLLKREKSPAAVIEQLNQVLLPDLEQTGVFISICLIVMDLEARTATYANAGHCPPMVFRTGQVVPISLEATGVPLGILDEPEYSEECIPLREGDTFILYTDGFTEARNAAGQFWGEEGMVECVVKGPRGDPESVSRALVEGALRHSNNKLDDDLTVLVLRIKQDPSEQQ
jgi:sigma-B regulation protein RsbU (phosphoserine phosphatase)